MGDGTAEGWSAIGDGGQEQAFRPHLMLMVQVLVPCWTQFYIAS